jgi:glucose/arabinose dehydrogenase/mono/diheme cytochrome c family protein
MQVIRCNQALLASFCVVAAALIVHAAPAPAQTASAGRAASSSTDCPQSGLKLPAGFCASVFADRIGHARHLVVAPNGVVYVNTWSGIYYGNDTPPPGGFLVALRDTTGKGKADEIKRFGTTAASGGHGGTGVALYDGALYAEIDDRIVRYRFTSNATVPQGDAETIVSGLPLTGDHPMHPFVIDADGMLYVDVASATNACQRQNRMLRSPGMNPCTELETRGGIWRYDAKRTGQKFSPAERYATGIRNADGLAIDSTGHGLYATQHGRDQLGQNWPALYKPQAGATLPAEELLRVTPGGDYGWPECYYDGVQRKLVLAPEYGGDGGRSVGPCAGKRAPIAAFPAHWAPDDLLLNYAKDWPAPYRDGAFIAFHGSWNRAPFPQGGYNVVFQSLGTEGTPGRCEIFADGFAGGTMQPGSAAHRPTGLALGPDGALYVSDDTGGRIYRIVYRGGSVGEQSGRHSTPCPAANAPAGAIATTKSEPPEGTNANAGAGSAANLPVPEGATEAMVALGDQIYHGRVAAAPCAGCHGPDATGTPLGPNLTANKWLWSDGSYDGIARSIAAGVSQPKAYRSPMPPNGGAELTHDQVSAVAAYVWALNHRTR